MIALSRFALLAMTAAFLLAAPVDIFASVDAPAKPEPEWITLETGYLTIYYKPGADLSRIEASLKKRATYFSSEIPSEIAPVEERIRYQLDALFRRAQDILGMRPADIHVKIKIFHTAQDVDNEYVKIFGAPKSGPAELKSFYVDKYNTIYISEENLSDSIIAHEMGHAIIDHYFAVIPPEKIGELLASYVDMHLAD